MKNIECGAVFGKLTVINLNGKNNHGDYVFKCSCECGKETIVEGYRLRTNKVHSCGCLQKEVAARVAKISHTTHGMRYTKIYRTWVNMIDRCYNKNHKYYHRYGGRGILVCKQWHKFPPFYEDMGDCPQKSTLERINNNKGYSLKNCTWATMSEQSKNRRVRSRNSKGQFSD